MKSKNNILQHLGFIALAFAGISTQSAQATNLSWDADATFDGNFGGDGTWDTSSPNWSDVASNVAWTTNTITGDMAVFTGTAGFVFLDTAINALGLQFTTPDYSVTGDTFSVGTGGIDASTLSSGTTTVGSAFVVADTQTWTVGSDASLLLGSTVTGASTGTQTLTVGGAGNTTIDGQLNDGATGTLNLTKSGAGYLKLNGAATNIAGALDIQGGSVGVVQDFTATGLTGTGTFENASSVDKLTFWDIGADQTFGGVFRNNDGVNTGLLGLVKRGTGTLTLTNNSSNQSANLTVDAGRLVLNNTGTFGTGNQGGATKTNLTASIGSVAAANGVLEINGATVNYNNRSATNTDAWRDTLKVATNATGAGALKISSGSLSTNRTLMLGAVNGTYGAMTQTNGTTNVGGYLTLALGTAGTTDSRGVLNVSGGNWNQAGTVALGARGTGVINLSGSVIYNQTSTGDAGLWVGEFGTGILNVSGNASLSVVSGSNGVMLGRNASAVGTLNLLGGTVTAKAVYKGTGTGTLNFNGGTLKANIANASFLNGLTNAYVHSGGGTINNDGFAVTVGQALLAPTGDGVSSTGLTVSGGGYIDTPVVTISGGGGSGATAVATIDGSGNLTGITMTSSGTGYTSVPTFTLTGGGVGNTGSIGGAATLVANNSGGMTFSGTGTTTLTGANTYTGDTIVTAGILAVNGTSIADANKLVLNGGKVDPMGATEVVGTLYFGATQQAAGTWGSSLAVPTPDHVDDINFTGTGVVSVTTGPVVGGYNSWASANGATGQTKDLDHDNDGVKNGIEYFMGQTGSTFTSNPAAVSGTVTWPMGATYTGVYGTDYEVQFSTDLAIWTKVEIGTGDNTVTVNPGPTPARSVVYDVPTGGKSFVRLVVKN